jgi:hypothetical protein
MISAPHLYLALGGVARPNDHPGGHRQGKGILFDFF